MTTKADSFPPEWLFKLMETRSRHFANRLSRSLRRWMDSLPRAGVPTMTTKDTPRELNQIELDDWKDTEDANTHMIGLWWRLYDETRAEWDEYIKSREGLTP